MKLEDALSALGVAINDLHRATVTDDKTPLQNALALQRHLVRLEESQATGIVVFGDLNGFKAVNDTYGHAAGDAAIRRAGSLIAQMIEPFGAAGYRQSGDEFVVLAAGDQPHVGLLDSLSTTFRLAHARHHDASGKSVLIEIRMSFGWTPIGGRREQWLERAEAACIAAKRQGAGAVLEWTRDMDEASAQSRRCRCADCSASFRVELPAGIDTPTDRLFCPNCGKQASASGAASDSSDCTSPSD